MADVLAFQPVASAHMARRHEHDSTMPATDAAPAVTNQSVIRSFMLTRLGVLQERDCRIFFAGYTASLAGSSMVPVALSFVVLKSGHGSGAVGAVLASETIPLLLLLLGGAMADRLPRRTVMIWADVLRLVSETALTILLVSGRPAVWVIMLLASMLGIGQAFFNPALTGFVPQIVTPDRLQDANALSGLSKAVADLRSGDRRCADCDRWRLVGGRSRRHHLCSQPRMPAQAAAAPRGQDAIRADPGRARARLAWLQGAALALVGGGAGRPCAVVHILAVPGDQRDHVQPWPRVDRPGSDSGSGRDRWPRGSPGGDAHAPPAAAGGGPAGEPWPGGTPVLLALHAALPLLLAVSVLSGVGVAVFLSLFDTVIQRNVPEALLPRVSAYNWLWTIALSPRGFALAGPAARMAGAPAVLLFGAAFALVSTMVLFAVPDVRCLKWRDT